MTLRLHNNLTRQVEPFAPLDFACPTMYLCGPTVYNYVHIGDARGPVVFGVLAALLRRRFGGLRYARNSTDIDDKIKDAAKGLGVPMSTVTDMYAAAYREDMAGLGVVPQDLQPEATAHVPHIIAMIERLIESATLLGLDDEAAFHLQRYRVAYPKDHVRWQKKNGASGEPLMPGQAPGVVVAPS